MFTFISRKTVIMESVSALLGRTWCAKLAVCQTVSVCERVPVRLISNSGGYCSVAYYD